MRLDETMIVWTPNRGVWADKPMAGKIAITKIPEDPALKAHPMSTGACDLNWREANDEERRALLQRYFTQMVHRDYLDADTVRTALSGIVDFNPLHLSADKPDLNDDSWQ